jgi:bisphosphoglycerate-dependent phosphoglycerate mutase
MNQKLNNNHNNSLYPAELHPSERKLIEAIRAINSGEIESIKIQNGLPVIFKITLGEGKFCEEE